MRRPAEQRRREKLPRLLNKGGFAAIEIGCDQAKAVTGLVARKELQARVTQDLAGFWERHYPAIRRELMRRYPKHAWPENGATASPPSVNRRP